MRRIVAALIVSLTVMTVARGQSGSTDAREFARQNNLTYEDIGQGTIRSARLSNASHKILLFGGSKSIVVDSETVSAAEPVTWSGSALMLPPDAVNTILVKIGAVPPPPPQTAETTVGASKPAASSFRVVPTRTTPYRVVIDPGHGGSQPGAIGPRTGLQEKTINLEVALRVGRLLEARGVKVTYTRKTDVTVELDDRFAIANRVRPDLFLSIHTNADARRDLRGAMTLFPDDGTNDGKPGIMARAREAAPEITADTFGAGGTVGSGAWLPAVSAAFEGNRILSIEAARRMQSVLSPITGPYFRDGGVIEDSARGLRVLRNVRAPAVLVEMDFLSNRTSEQRLARTAYRNSLADAIAKGVMEYLESSAE